MDAGHAAVALAATKAAPRVNVGWLVFAAFLSDFLFGFFVLMGKESVHIPADYASRHYLTFTFPYSHGLLLLLLWGTLFGLLVSFLQQQDRPRAFVVVTALVLSHFLLDGLVHVVGLPLIGEGSPKFGLGLWRNVPLELVLETIMAAVGIGIYLRLSTTSPAWSRWSVASLIFLLTIMTWGQLFQNRAPAPSQLAIGWILLPLLVSAALFGLDGRRAASF